MNYIIYAIVIFVVCYVLIGGYCAKKISDKRKDIFDLHLQRSEQETDKVKRMIEKTRESIDSGARPAGKRFKL